ncbi:MAG: alanyl-tRNA editing protein [Oscillospiraceae bacterium]|nr:alanyl-tRNA editing protein [Oscillospiraceae bacterium]
MTEKLYYSDSFMKEFTATVVSCEAEKENFAVTLDRTAFYPEGGGQSADHGTLNDVHVLDTRDRGGEVVHICDKPLTVGETVRGAIDFARRLDLMQQHSGEHIVSGIICGKFGCDNVGFHVGKDTVTIDFNADITTDDLREVESLANRYIQEDHDISITFPSPEELAALPYRSKKELTGEVRIVAFPGADCCACCGTHVKSSGQVGLVKLLSVTKFREGVRIEMLAGNRAIEHYTTILEQNTRISQSLSAKSHETAAAVERLQAQIYALQGRIAALESADHARKAAEYAGKGNVLLIEDDMSAESVRKLADAVLEQCGGRCAVFAGSNGNYKYAIGEKDGDLRSLVKELNAALSGRGGGKPNFAQGSAACTEEQIRAFFADK